jgi:hypothetical protein
LSRTFVEKRPPPDGNIQRIIVVWFATSGFSIRRRRISAVGAIYKIAPDDKADELDRRGYACRGGAGLDGG